MALITEATGVTARNSGAVPETGGTLRIALPVDQVAAMLDLPPTGIRNLVARGILKQIAGMIACESIAAYQRDEGRRRTALDHLLADTNAQGN